MVDLLPARPILTPADVGNQLSTEGLDALGLSIPALATGWASATPAAGDVDGVALTITLTGIRAPFQGILQHEPLPTVWSTPSGSPVTGPVAVLRLHPDAGAKLVAFLTGLLGGPLVRPVPVAMVVHGIPAPPTPQALDSYRAGEALDVPAGAHPVSFHDERGLPIHPLAVASLLLAVQQAVTALAFGDPTQPALGAPGAVDSIAGLDSSTVVHVVDPHGRGYAARGPGSTLHLIDGATTTDLTGAPVTWPDAATVGRTAAEQTADDARPRLFWGFSHHGTLARAPLAVPALPPGVTLDTQFLRVTAVDLDWHLLGNRSTSPVQGVGGDDGSVAPFLQPVVRPFVPGATYLTDAQDVLGGVGQALDGFPPAGAPDVQLLLCSPAIEESLAVPPAPGPAGHWPTFPPGPATVLPVVVDATAGLSGSWASGTGSALDAIVTLAADVVPAGTHVRVYPRRFQTIRSIGERPSFLRGDGGSVLAVAGTASSVLLENPFGLLPAESRPDPAVLMVDVVVTGRDGARRIASMVPVTLGADQPFTPTGFGGTAVLQQPAIAALTAAFGSTSVAPATLFGIPDPPAAGGTPGTIIDLVRALASETTRPRRGPALPTQARFETVLARGVQPVAGQPYAWTSVLSGSRWQAESRSAVPELADPGNPAGPDVFATGMSVGGQLAQDLALHAMKRAQPVLPLGGDTAGWVVATGGDNWSPAPLDGPGATVSGVMLETVAPFCDSPELSFLPEPQPGDSVQSAVDDFADRLGVPAPTVTVENEDQIRDRLQREIVTAKRGQRDALWSLRRALAQAREFVYLESTQFARTALPDDTPAAHEVDLVEVLLQALSASPRLRVMIAVPRVPDFDPTVTRYEPFVRAALAQRKNAIEALSGPHRDRVAAFHPIGFPGRPTFLRSATVVVDDVFALVGTSHLRRRGMTFDGGCDVASIDRQLDGRGVSSAIRRFRQELMASRLGVAVPAGPATTTAMWTRLSTGEGAFGLLADLLAAGGLGRCQPVWAGPTDEDVLPKPDAVSDPDGVDADGSGLLALFLDELIS